MLLLIVGIIFVVSAFIGYKKGLVKIVASLLATLIAILLVSLVSPYISKLIRTVTPLESSVQNKVAGLLMPETDTASGEAILGSEVSRDDQTTMIEGAKLPGVFRQMLLDNNNSEVYAALGVNTFKRYVAAYITKIIADIIAFLISVLIVLIAVRVLIKMLGILNKLPVIGGLNRLGGGIVGLGVGLIAVWILFFVVTLLYDTSLGRMCFENIESSSILTTLYNSNIIMKSITRF